MQNQNKRQTNRLFALIFALNRHGGQVVHQYDLGHSISHELDVDVPGFFNLLGIHLTAVGNTIFFISPSRRDKIFLQH